MKKFCLALALLFCLVGVALAAAPNPQPPDLTGVGGSWTGTVRVISSAGVPAVVPIKLVITSQTGPLLVGTLTVNNAASAVTGTIDNGSYIYLHSISSPYFNLNANLGWYPGCRIIVNNLTDGTSNNYGDSLLLPTATP